MTTSLERRKNILSMLVKHLKPLDVVNAMWEAGAAAFDRVDQWSDIDLMLDVADGRAQEAIEAVEEALISIAPIEFKYRLPDPTWHGHAQVFYRLEDHGPFLLIDLVVMNHSDPNKFLEKEIHGFPVIHFDKSNIVSAVSVNEEDQLRILTSRLEELKTRFELFQSLCVKEIYRRNAIEALAFYHGFTLRPLVEALRIYYSPHHYQFFTRYIQHDLPPEINADLETLFFVSSLSDIASKREHAEAWFHRTIDRIMQEKRIPSPSRRKIE